MDKQNINNAELTEHTLHEIKDIKVEKEIYELIDKLAKENLMGSYKLLSKQSKIRKTEDSLGTELHIRYGLYYKNNKSDFIEVIATMKSSGITFGLNYKFLGRYANSISELSQKDLEYNFEKVNSALTRCDLKLTTEKDTDIKNYIKNLLENPKIKDKDRAIEFIGV